MGVMRTSFPIIMSCDVQCFVEDPVIIFKNVLAFHF